MQISNRTRQCVWRIQPWFLKRLYQSSLHRPGGPAWPAWSGQAGWPGQLLLLLLLLLLLRTYRNVKMAALLPFLTLWHLWFFHSMGGGGVISSLHLSGRGGRGSRGEVNAITSSCIKKWIQTVWPSYFSLVAVLTAKVNKVLSTACLYKKNGKLPALPLHSAQGNQDPQSHNTLGVCSKRT